MQRHELEHLNREELISLAERLSVPRPRVLTQPELIDEILTRTSGSKRDLARARGWFGRARDLLASVVERGLHLPEVARVLRATPASRSMPTPPPPLATVTLAEIYAAQGHLDRAITVLDEVLLREPAHETARKLRERFREQTARATVPTREPDAQPSREQADALTDEAAEPQAVAPAEAEPQPVAPAEAEPEPTAHTEAEPQPVAPAEAEPEPIAHTEAEPQPVAPAEADVVPPAEPAVAQDQSASEASETSESPEPLADVVPQPLPTRYNVDEVVAIAVDSTTLYFYWEVRPTTLARIRAARPNGAMIARVISVVPSWEGPQVSQRDVRIDLLYGDHTERGIQSGAHIRVSIGWLSGADFDPIAIAAEVEVPRALATESISVHVGQWTQAPQGLPFGPTGDGGMHHAMFAASQGSIGPITRLALGGFELRGAGGLSPQGFAGGAGPAAPAPSEGSSPLGGASELPRAERTSAG